MNKGTVKFYDSTKRFGFIKEDGTEEEHFVHSSGLIDEIKAELNNLKSLEAAELGFNSQKQKFSLGNQNVYSITDSKDLLFHRS